MTIGTLGSSLTHLSDLFGGGTTIGLSDAELLRRYAGSHDGPAFAALVARHGPMVAATCRAVLRDHHDAEDAFQATFLVLARRAGSIQSGDALGGWLHRVAYRAALQRSIEARRKRRIEVEAPPMEIPDTVEPGLDADVCAVLHEEIDRLPEAQRLAVVLCDLEGLTYEQAAGRLRCTVPALYHRLARGRKRLRDRLARRGITAVVVGAVLALSRASATAAVPTAWATAAMAAATGGAIPPAVAALTGSLLRSLLMTRLKMMTVGALTLGALISAGAAALAATRPDPANPPPTATPPSPMPPPSAVEKTPTRPGRLTVEARDLATDVPVPDVRFELSVRDETDSKAKFTSRTDAAGAALFSLMGEVRYLYVSATRPGYVSQAIRWDHKANAPDVPDHLLFQMEKATTVTGCVVDQDEKPIAGATVVIRVSKRYPKSGQWVDFQWEKARTDANGRWSFSGVPEKPDSVELGVYDYRCLTGDDHYPMEAFRPLAALRDGTATLRLRRGTPVEVMVRSAAGRPVADAEVFCGQGRRYANAIPPARTDARGRLLLGIQPGAIKTLAVRAPGHGPAIRMVQVGTKRDRVDLMLPDARVLKGRVVDPGRRPIAGATVNLAWSGPETSAQASRSDEAIVNELKTDADGRFAWAEAPGRGVRLSIYAPGFSVKEDLLVDSNGDHEIVLTPPTVVKGSVIDAATGQPIPRFTLSDGAVWHVGERLIWQRSGDFDEDAKKSPGSFEYVFSNPAHQHVVRVSAEGYLPEDSGRFSLDGTTHAFTFRLTRAGPIRGTVTRPDGSPSGEGFVYVVPGEAADAIDYLDILNGEVRNNRRLADERASIEPDGRFSLPPRRGNFALVCLSEAGFAVVHRRELPADGRLRLRPWARISGTVTQDGRPTADLGVRSWDPDDTPPTPDEPRIEHRYFVKTDAQGRFDLHRVFPGRLELVRWVPNGTPRRHWFINMATVDVVPGRAYELAIGRSGRRVTGRLEIPASDLWMIRKAEIVARNAKEEKPASIGVEIRQDGRFQAEDLRPGDYRLRIALHEPPAPDACGWGRLIAAYDREFTVTGTAEESPFDLGRLRPAEVTGHSLKVGDIAPDFAFHTLDGKGLSLADFRGKFVLLDFWATWCAPCLAEMPHLADLHKAFGADSRFALISVSLDEKPAQAAFVVNSERWTWRQGHLDPESPTVAAYGATAIPATFLIGPDGKILAAGLRGKAIKAAVTAALAPPSAP